MRDDKRIQGRGKRWERRSCATYKGATATTKTSEESWKIRKSQVLEGRRGRKM